MSQPWDDSERAALVALLRARPGGATWQQLAHEVGERGSALAVWRQLHRADLFDDGSQAPELTAAVADLAAWRAAELGFLTFLDEGYPARLREVADFPPVLFHRGTLSGGEPAVAVVGSRSASERGLRVARNVSAGLVDRGIAVLSGLARGVDTAAHETALAASGRTVAVIGTGITKYYPVENRALQDRIAREGLVISQFWPDAAPRQQQFPMRNAVMSGYGMATIVVEAGEKSGARIQARQAVAHGRPVILTDLVVKANEWPKRLIGRPGVYEATSTDQVLAIVDELVRAADELDHLLAAART